MPNGTDPASQAAALVTAWDAAQECLIALKAKIDADCQRLVLDFAGKAQATPGADDYVTLQAQLQGVLDKHQKQAGAIAAVLGRIEGLIQGLARSDRKSVEAAVSQKVAALENASAKAAMETRIKRIKGLPLDPPPASPAAPAGAPAGAAAGAPAAPAPAAATPEPGPSKGKKE